MSVPTVVRIVDLGFAMARVKVEKFANGTHTNLTLMTPALTEEGVTQPAQSAQVYMTGDSVARLVEALTAPIPGI